MTANLVDHFRAMTWNNRWSNHRLLTACARLSQDEYRAKRVSFFPSLHLTLNHILIVDWFYLDALEEGGRGRAVLENEEPCATMAELAHEQRQADLRLIANADGLDDTRLERVVTLDRPDGPKLEHAGDVLAHLFVHQIHHRGQVHAMLAGTTVEPPQLDEFFLAQDAALRAADLEEIGFTRGWSAPPSRISR